MKVRSSRRSQGLKPSDYDHEIVLVNDDDAPSSASQDPAFQAQISRTGTVSRLLTEVRDSTPSTKRQDLGDESETDRYGNESANETNATGASSPQIPSGERRDIHIGVGPSIDVQAPTPAPVPPAHHYPESKKSRDRRETAVDILYENERGGFLCGAALFSSKALGGLDAPPWTNAFHKPSLTDTNTAQVPDPSWEWAWPEWRVNHQEGMDEFGWEYSFAFSKRFSWHKAKWWNSFVRRRAWIRRRVKKREDEMCSDPHMLNTDYFTVRPASQRTRLSGSSSLSSRVHSKTSLSQLSNSETTPENRDITDIVMLMQIMRSSRIDREKREAVENYLEHGKDLESLESEMHEIMSLFVFQASRRALLCHLMRKHDETSAELAKDDTLDLRERKDALDAAARHADEEVRKLAYWSDIKHMVANGESRLSLEDDQACFYETYEGIDDSGPLPPNKGKLPA